MTLQEILDHVYLALIKQGCRSTTDDGELCMFRNEHGDKCAVGHLIPGDEYDPEMDDPDGLGNSQVLRIIAEKLQVERTFLLHLQHCHDKADDDNFAATFTAKITAFAKEYNLNVPA